MSHIVIRLYSFECDAPGCQATVDVTPTIHGGIREARQLLRDESDLREFGTFEKWAATRAGEFCPRHRPDGAA